MLVQCKGDMKQGAMMPSYTTSWGGDYSDGARLWYSSVAAACFSASDSAPAE